MWSASEQMGRQGTVGVIRVDVVRSKVAAAVASAPMWEQVRVGVTREGAVVEISRWQQQRHASMWVKVPQQKPPGLLCRRGDQSD